MGRLGLLFTSDLAALALDRQLQATVIGVLGNDQIKRLESIYYGEGQKYIKYKITS